MKKWTFLYFLCPLLVGAQHIDWDRVPHKSSFTSMLQSIDNNYTLDTTNTGYSTLQYHSFSSKGQFIKVNHQQYFTDYLLFDLDFDKFSHEGIFNRENLKLHNVHTKLFFNNKKKTYQAHLSLGYHKIKMDENGGIFNYAYALFDDPLLNPITLLSAENEAKNRNHSFAQNFKLTDNWSVSNEISILSNRRVYSDQSPNSGFYPHIYLDSIQTYDSLSTLVLSQRFGLSYKDFTISQLLHHRKAFIHTVDSSDTDWGIALDYENINYAIHLKSEFYQSNHYFITLLKRFSGERFSQLISIAFDRKRVPIFSNTFSSNHYRFNTDFTPTSRVAAAYALKHKNWSLGSEIYRYTDYIYLDQSAHFQQFTTSFLHWQNSLNFKWNWKRLYTTQNLVYHRIEDSSPLRLPTFNYNTSIWLESHLFGDNLNTQIGAKLNYFTRHFANAYNPALAQYHLQDEQRIGDVPLLSAFLKLHVHNMSINVSYHNLLSLVNENSNIHYFIPNYPSYPASIQLSVLWKLKND